MSAIIESSNILAVEHICAIIICKSCKIGLPSERSAKAHLNNKHSLENSIAKLMSEKASAAAQSASEIPHPMRNVYHSAPDAVSDSDLEVTSFLPPLEGIDTTTGFSCPICRCCYSSERGIRDHFVEKHSNYQLSPDEMWQKCQQAGSIRLQSLFSGVKTKLFPVAASTPIGEVQSAPLSSQPNSMAQKPSKCPPPVYRIQEPENGKSIPTDPDSIQDSNKDVIDTFAEIDNAFFNVVDTEDEVMRSHMNAFIARTKFDVLLRNQNITMPDAATYSGLLDNRLKEESIVVDDVSNYLLKVPNLVFDIAPSVLHDINLRGDKEFTVVSTRAAERYGRNFARIVISAIRVEKVGLVPNYLLAPLQAYRVILSNPLVDQKCRLGALHALLKSICLHRLDKMDSPKSLFVYHFTAFAAIVTMSRSQTNAFRFANASDISPVLAALLYGASSCALTEIYQLGTQLRSLRNDPSLSKEDFENSRQRLNDALENIISSLEESENSAASFIRKTLTIANQISKKDDVEFVFDECETHPLCGIINNVHIRMNRLGDIIKRLHENIKLSFSSLLHGASLPHEFFTHLGALQDIVQDKSTGFSFLSYGPNKKKSQNFTIWLFNQITNERPSGKAEFCPSQSTTPFDFIRVFGKNIKRKAVEKWLSRIQDVQDMLLACTHLSSGSPGRATELETLHLYNNSYALRNIYIIQGRIVVVTRYSKTRTLAGWDKVIPRFPDQETSKHFLTYLVLFRSLETIFVKELYGDKVMKSHLEAVFVERGTNYSSSRIRDVIRAVLHKHGLHIEFNDFRHLAVAMVPEITKNSPSLLRDDLIAETRFVAHLQAGHSPQVAEHSYARKPSDIPSLPTSALARYRMFSTEWHRSLGLLRPTPVANPVSKHNPPISSTDVETLSSSLANSISEKVVCEVKRDLQIFSNSLKKKRSLPEDFPIPSAQKQFPSKLRLPADCNIHHDLNKLLPSLRVLLKTANVMFTSETQLKVATAICEARHDLMVLMPTGSGKTLSFLLPVFLEESLCSTVIIVPLAALVHEHVRTCYNLGISVATWANRNEDVQVYVFSIDHNLSEMRGFLIHLQNKNKLRRIVIDEAHLIILWSLFRSSIRRLPYALKSRGHYVQVVLLTATLPPYHRETLLDLLGIPSAVLYSQPTVRHNLRFRVIDTTVSSNQQRFVPHQKLMTDTLCKEVYQLAFSMLQRDGGRILIFVLYKQEAERLEVAVKEFLEHKLRQNVSIRAYHAGMPSNVLKEVFEYWKAEDAKLKIIVATQAFATGVHADNVEGTFHYGGSNGLLQYAQEAGRAGRSGNPAQCTIIYNKTYAEHHLAKVLKQDDPLSFSDNGLRDDQTQEWLLMEDYMTQTTMCRKNQLFAHIDGNGPGMCIFDKASVNCDVCEHYQASNVPEDDLLASQHVSFFPSPNSNTPQVTPQPSPAISHSVLTLPIHLHPHNISSITPPQLTPFQSRSTSLPSYSSPRGPLPVQRRLSFSNSQHGIEIVDSRSSTINRFRSACHSLQNLCIACLVINGRQDMANHRCSDMKNRCKRCFHIGHQVSDCSSFEPRRKNYCFGCSLSQIEGENVHKPGEFGGKCFMGVARNIAWAFWGKDSIARENLAGSLFRDIELANLQKCEENENVENSYIRFYDTWLQTIWNGVPNYVRFFLWWHSNINLE